MKQCRPECSGEMSCLLFLGLCVRLLVVSPSAAHCVCRGGRGVREQGKVAAGGALCLPSFTNLRCLSAGKHGRSARLLLLLCA